MPLLSNVQSSSPESRASFRRRSKFAPPRPPPILRPQRTSTRVMNEEECLACRRNVLGIPTLLDKWLASCISGPQIPCLEATDLDNSMPTNPFIMDFVECKLWVTAQLGEVDDFFADFHVYLLKLKVELPKNHSISTSIHWQDLASPTIILAEYDGEPTSIDVPDWMNSIRGKIIKFKQPRAHVLEVISAITHSKAISEQGSQAGEKDSAINVWCSKVSRMRPLAIPASVRVTRSAMPLGFSTSEYLVYEDFTARMAHRELHGSPMGVFRPTHTLTHGIPIPMTHGFITHGYVGYGYTLATAYHLYGFRWVDG
ncbi:hypothetical protein CPC08DRAFT_536760 [Agrocybe pediades]|nr:hypothetical protein CPC08DRAFT_536760 [Agrocybe pediades]